MGWRLSGKGGRRGLVVVTLVAAVAGVLLLLRPARVQVAQVVVRDLAGRLHTRWDGRSPHRGGPRRPSTRQRSAIPLASAMQCCSDVRLVPTVTESIRAGLDLAVRPEPEVRA